MKTTCETVCAWLTICISALLFSCGNRAGSEPSDNGTNNNNEIHLVYIPSWQPPLILPEAIEIGSRLELFTDHYLIEHLEGAALRLHEPQRMPMADSPITGFYTTVIKVGDLYRAWYRGSDRSYKGPFFSGHPGQVTFYSESHDGHEWEHPSLGLFEINGSWDNNAVLAQQPPFSANFSPFLDTRPGIDPDARYKALAGHPRGGQPDPVPPEERDGLHAFFSPDGLHWEKVGDEPVIPFDPEWHHAFDSQNVSFWSEAEQQYVCYFRTWVYCDVADRNIRTISRTTSPDFLHWTPAEHPVPNLPGEHLYTSQTHPYFRAPHIYIALPTRYMAGQLGEDETDPMIGSTDIMFMTWRAGEKSYRRTFKEAFIRPGLDPVEWGNRANYVALNVVPTGPSEMSIYHRFGHRYVLRTDGFASVYAGAQEGELLTRVLTFSGERLVLNFRTAAAGRIQVELQYPDGTPIPGFRLEDCSPMTGNDTERVVNCVGDPILSILSGTPVRLRFVLREADLFSFQFCNEPTDKGGVGEIGDGTGTYYGRTLEISPLHGNTPYDTGGVFYIGAEGGNNTVRVMDGGTLNYEGTTSTLGIILGRNATSHDNQLIVEDGGLITNSSEAEWPTIRIGGRNEEGQGGSNNEMRVDGGQVEGFRLAVGLGDNTDNKLRVLNGGVVDGDYIIVGQSANTSGNEVEIHGEDSLVSVRYLFTSNNDGPGNNSIRISNGGVLELRTGSGIIGRYGANDTLDVLSGGLFTVGAHLEVGEFPGDGNHRITVSGATSMLTVNDELVVGGRADGNRLEARDRATAAIGGDVTIGLDGSNNTLEVTGSGSSFTSDGTVTVSPGGAPGNKLQVGANARFESVSMLVNANGAFEIVTATAGIAQELTVASGGNLTLSGNALVHVGAGYDGVENMYTRDRLIVAAGGALTANGSLSMGLAGKLLVNSGGEVHIALDVDEEGDPARLTADVVDIEGGTLRFSLPEAPEAGNVRIFAAGSVTGTFDELDTSAVEAEGWSVYLDSLYTDGTVTLYFGNATWDTNRYGIPNLLEMKHWGDSTQAIADAYRDAKGLTFFARLKPFDDESVFLPAKDSDSFRYCDIGFWSMN